MEPLRLFPNAEFKGSKDSYNRPHGVGCLKDSASGVEYIGEMVRGFANGHGLLKTPEGERFAGQFRNGSIDGYGVHNTANGITIVGLFRNGTCLTVEGQVQFDDQSYGLPRHEGSIHQKEGLKEMKKCPDAIATGLEHAERASQIVDMFLGVHADDDTVKDENAADLTDEKVSETDEPFFSFVGATDDTTEQLSDAEIDPEIENVRMVMEQFEAVSPEAENYGSQVFLLDDASSTRTSITNYCSKKEDEIVEAIEPL